MSPPTDPLPDSSKSLPPREVSTDDGVTVRVYFVGPVREGGRDERLAYYDIQVGFAL